MTTFIGRAHELATLESAWRGDKSAFVPVYGRRRVGKSELIRQFLRGKNAIYYLGKQAAANLELTEFAQAAALAVDEPLLAERPPTTWRDLLRLTVSRWRGEGKLALVLDEFQWTAASSPELPAVLQELWDREWRDSGRVFLILCGSYLGFMEREVLGSKSPLFGRRTAQILLRPFGYQEAAAFHPAYSKTDAAMTYFLCGGLPYYLGFFDDRRSVEQNIVTQILGEHAALRREPEFLLREELRELETYQGVLSAMAAGRRSPSEIGNFVAIDPRKLSYYLQGLLDLGYIERTTPLDPAGASSRRVLYSIAEPLLRFFYRFIFPAQSYLQLRGPETFYRDLIRPQLDAYFGAAFERLSREGLAELYAREGVLCPFEIGHFWNDQVQIDVVGRREDHIVDLGECKWGAVRSPAAVEQELAAKLTRLTKSTATLRQHIFCRKKPKDAASRAVFWHDLDDLYGE